MNSDDLAAVREVNVMNFGGVVTSSERINSSAITLHLHMLVPATQ